MSHEPRVYDIEEYSSILRSLHHPEFYWAMKKGLERVEGNLRADAIMWGLLMHNHTASVYQSPELSRDISLCFLKDEHTAAKVAQTMERYSRIVPFDKKPSPELVLEIRSSIESLLT